MHFVAGTLVQRLAVYLGIFGILHYILDIQVFAVIAELHRFVEKGIVTVDDAVALIVRIHL